MRLIAPPLPLIELASRLPVVMLLGVEIERTPPPKVPDELISPVAIAPKLLARAIVPPMPPLEAVLISPTVISPCAVRFTVPFKTERASLSLIVPLAFMRIPDVPAAIVEAASIFCASIANPRSGVKFPIAPPKLTFPLPAFNVRMREPSTVLPNAIAFPVIVASFVRVTAS